MASKSADKAFTGVYGWVKRELNSKSSLNWKRSCDLREIKYN